jgi:hypothetical protein
MFEVDAPSSLRVLAQLEDPVLRRRLEEIAGRITTSYPRALGPAMDSDGLVARALARVLDPELDPWDPGKLSLFRHMAMVMRDLWLAALPQHAELADELRAQLVDEDPDSLRVFEALAGGVPQGDVPKLLGMKEHKVVTARRRFLFRATHIKERQQAPVSLSSATRPRARSKEDPR